MQWGECCAAFVSAPISPIAAAYQSRVASHAKALKAQAEGLYDDEIVPVTTVLKNGEEETGSCK